LLLRKCGDVTPLLHAMRIGKSHNDVAIILLGAFSRYINHLTDEDLKVTVNAPNLYPLIYIGPSRNLEPEHCSKLSVGATLSTAHSLTPYI